MYNFNHTFVKIKDWVFRHNFHNVIFSLWRWHKRRTTSINAKCINLCLFKTCQKTDFSFLKLPWSRLMVLTHFDDVKTGNKNILFQYCIMGSCFADNETCFAQWKRAMLKHGDNLFLFSGRQSVCEPRFFSLIVKVFESHYDNKAPNKGRIVI